MRLLIINRFRRENYYAEMSELVYRFLGKIFWSGDRREELYEFVSVLMRFINFYFCVKNSRIKYNVVKDVKVGKFF